ncbi:MAG: 3-deoxy-D-manno-octulosonic acid transferase [Alphaproteobacteria bacterium]|nr:3-deoxy-D-manno-octulosonic acid transferase [Alphaproteobacteria bacterium]
MMLALYRTLTFLLHPLMALHLRCRLRKGKEDPVRWRERLGHSSPPQNGTKGSREPAAHGGASLRSGAEQEAPNKRIWIHAASVGESLSILPLLQALMAAHPSHSFLVTTGTVTSARLMAERLPAGVTHAFAPVDTPQAVSRFLDRWKPQTGIWVESELWPNMVMMARERGVKLALVNGRLSERSARRWKRMQDTIATLLSAFRVILAQSDGDLARFQALGARHAACVGNLKYDAAETPVNEPAVAALRQALGDRPLWVASSTHPGEEQLIIEAHRRIRETHPAALMILIPRHPSRGAEIAALLTEKNTPFSRRSEGSLPLEDAACYLADTLGEVGIFYTLSPIVFLGGSLVPVGGHNPLEPALLNCALLLGPHTFNFSQILEDLTSKGAATVIHDAPELAETVSHWMEQTALAKRQADAAFQVVKTHQGVALKATDALRTVIS